jgi:PAS domain S-box-containing protein
MAKQRDKPQKASDRLQPVQRKHRRQMAMPHPSQALLQDILDQASAAIVRMQVFATRDWAYEYFSAGCETLFGYSATELMANPKLWLSRVVPEDRETIIWPLFEQFFAKSSVKAEYRFRRKDGQVCWIASAYTVHHDKARDCWHVTIVNTDISDRKQAEADLQLNERKLRAIFDSAFAFMGVLSPDGIILEANQTALNVIAAKRSDVIGQPFWDTAWWNHSPTQQQLLKQAIVNATAGNFVRFEAQHLFPDGTTVVVDFSLNPVFDSEGKVVMLIPEGRDITARKQAEASLHESENRLQLAFEGSGDGLWDWDITSGQVYFSPQWQQMLGYQNGDLMGNVEVWQQLIHPDDLPWVMERLEEHLKDGSVPYRFDYRVRTKSNEWKWIANYGKVVVRDAQGNPRRMTGTHRDISDKKQLEAQFLRAQRLESLGILASGIAHDLNNILTPILATAQLLPLKTPKLDAQTQHLLEMLQDSARRGSDLVQQILAFVRGGDGKRISLRINHILRDIRQIIIRTFPKSITLEVEASCDLQSISADVTQLHQVFMNLCVNARDAMPNGGTLCLRAENRILDTAFAQLYLDAQPGPYVVVTVSDTGTGMSPEVLEHIFDPFFTTKEAGKGTGLGLSTVAGIVKNHSGFVLVESEVGKGTQFQVFLPATDTLDLLPSINSEMPKGQGELILVVDDEIAIREVMKATLSDLNYRVMAVADGLEAINYVAQSPNEIAVVLMDIMMPSMSGLTAIRTLRRLQPQLKIIAISGLASNQVLAKAADADAFLLKPFTLQDLLHTLQAELQLNRTNHHRIGQIEVHD